MEINSDLASMLGDDDFYIKYTSKTMACNPPNISEKFSLPFDHLITDAPSWYKNVHSLYTKFLI